VSKKLPTSPMFTRIGGKESLSVPGGLVGTDDQLEFVRISRPDCEVRWKSRVNEP